MKKLIKVKPMFNRIITTMDTYEKDQYNGAILDTTKQKGSIKEYQKVISVGTTSCRVLETIADEKTGMVKPTEGDTQIFIYPGYKIKCIDGLITNFHLPQSTLLMLVSALAGKDYIMKAYNQAVEKKYRFFSFGDAMFIRN